jgi:fibronectin type 3 domain-containing protein
MRMQAIRPQAKVIGTFLLTVLLGGCSTSAPNAPAGLTVSSDVSRNTLTWNPVSGCVYNIYRGTATGSETALYSTDDTTLVDTPPVSSATSYYYYVTAVDSDGYESAASNEVSVTPPVLGLGAVSPSSVSLTWGMPSSASAVSSYNIYRSTSSGLEAVPVLASLTATSYVDTSVVHGPTYYYRVTAVGQNGETLGSNEVSAAP